MADASGGPCGRWEAGGLDSLAWPRSLDGIFQMVAYRSVGLAFDVPRPRDKEKLADHRGNAYRCFSRNFVPTTRAAAASAEQPEKIEKL